MLIAADHEGPLQRVGGAPSCGYRAASLAVPVFCAEDRQRICERVHGRHGGHACGGPAPSEPAGLRGGGFHSLERAPACKRALQQPQTACNTPDATFLSLYDGVTIGILCFLAFVGALWSIGRALLRRQRGFSADLDSVARIQAAEVAFDRLTLSRLVFFLQIAYAPLLQIVLGIFSCRQLGETHVLWADPGVQCSGAGYRVHRAVGGFWIVLYVAGIPLFFAALLFYYRIPIVAWELVANARLRAVIDCGRLRGVAQPDEGELEMLTVETISEEYIDALYAELLDQGGAGGGSELPASRKLSALLSYAGAELPMLPVTWARQVRRDALNFWHSVCAALYGIALSAMRTRSS